MYIGKSAPRSQMVDPMFDRSSFHHMLLSDVELYYSKVRSVSEDLGRQTSHDRTRHNLPRWSAQNIKYWSLTPLGQRGTRVVMHEIAYAILVCKWLGEHGRKVFKALPGWDENLSCKLYDTLPAALPDTGVICGNVFATSGNNKYYAHRGHYSPGSHAIMRNTFHAKGARPRRQITTGEMSR